MTGEQRSHKVEFVERVLPFVFRTYILGSMVVGLVLYYVGLINSEIDKLISCGIIVAGGISVTLILLLLYVWHIDGFGFRPMFDGQLRVPSEPLKVGEKVLYEERWASGFFGKPRSIMCRVLHVQLTTHRLIISFMTSAKGLALRNIPIELIVYMRESTASYRTLGTVDIVEIPVDGQDRSHKFSLITADPQSWIQAWQKAKSATTSQDGEV